MRLDPRYICSSGRQFSPAIRAAVAESAVLPAGVVAPERVTPARPELEDRYDDALGGTGFIVIVYDNDYNTIDQVIGILQRATGCTLEEAEIETWEVHHLGNSVVHHADAPECERVAGIIRTIGIRVEVVEE